MDPKLTLTPLHVALVGLSVAIYARIALTLHRRGGRVDATPFRLGDVLASFVLISFFGAMAVLAALQDSAVDPATVKPEHILSNSLLQLAIIAGIAGFLSIRGLRLRDQFGLWARDLPRGFVWGFALVLAAFPIIYGVAVAWHSLLQNRAVEQELVKLFRELATRPDHTAMWHLVFSGAVVAPVMEEFLFRGYFYGTGKRYVGAFSSGLITAILFAAAHPSLSALPALFTLALCLTVAYELTGSLWVPMCMHALFNSATLAVQFHQASQSAP